MNYVKLTIQDKKEKIELLINQALTISEISRILGVAKGTIYYWIKKFKLTPATFGYLQKDGKTFKRCYKCKSLKEFTKEHFIIRKRGGAASCKECGRIKSFEDSRKFKEKCLTYKGGRCEKCGYNQCQACIDFHHTDPTKKDFSVSTATRLPWIKVMKELDKCVPLCKNCHYELHYMENS